MRRILGLGALAALAVLGSVAGSAPSGAGSPPPRSVTVSELAVLLDEAATSDAALAEVRAITEVDGRPVDLGAATDDLGDGADRAGRLAAIAAAFGAAGAGTASTDPATARRAAAEVLEQSKYQDATLPRPFRGPLRWLGDRLRPLTDALGGVVDRAFEVAEVLPGGRVTMVVIVGGLLALGAWALARRRTGALVQARAGWRLADPEADPGELEGEAGRAEVAGDLARAVRLRYEAGILRLARAGRIRLEPSTTAAQVAAQAADDAVEALTATFEAVVYGGREATERDVAEAVAGWRQVLQAVPA